MTDGRVAERRARATDRAGLRWWKEVLLAGGVYVVYSVVRNQFGSAGGDPGPAYGHAVDIIDLEQALHLYFEPDAAAVVPRPPGQRAHPPVERVLRHRPLPRDVHRARVDVPARPRSATGCCATRSRSPPCLAVIGFAAYSLMPPRLLDDPGRVRRLPGLRAGGGRRRRARRAHRAGLRRVRLRRHGRRRTAAGSASATRGTKDVSNQYAAMPSMHIGWATWTRDRARCRWCAAAGRKGSSIAYPVITLVCIVLTANHYWIDGVGGLVCLGVGYGLARVDHATRAAVAATPRDQRLSRRSHQTGGRGSRRWPAAAPRRPARW